MNEFRMKLKRRFLKEEYTLGRLSVNGQDFCDILEPKVVDRNRNGVFDGDEKKIMGQTAIPYGTYKVAFTYSPRFKRELPILLNVVGFRGIRIHPGNTVDDTAGCLLPGLNKAKGKVLESRKYSDMLNELIEQAQRRGDYITLTIE